MYVKPKHKIRNCETRRKGRENTSRYGKDCGASPPKSKQAN